MNISRGRHQTRGSEGKPKTFLRQKKKHVDIGIFIVRPAGESLYFIHTIVSTEIKYGPLEAVVALQDAL